MRFQLEKHTNDSVWCWRVIDTLAFEGIHETYGFGLTETDAAKLAEELERQEQP